MVYRKTRGKVITSHQYSCYSGIQMLNWLFILISTVSIVQGCVTIDNPTPEHININFTIDSFKVYPTQNIPLVIFVFSPIAEYNKIWALSSTNTYELDLALGTWTPMSEKYDGDFKGQGQVKESSIWKDSLTNEVFISLYSKCLLHFKPEQDTFFRYPIQLVTAVLNTKDTILAGTTNGLYYIDKHTKNISRAPGFPIDKGVNTIEVYNADTLLINNGGLFYPARLNQPGKMTRHVNELRNIANNGYFDMLPHETRESRYLIQHDGQLHFYYSVQRVFFQDSTKTLFEIKSRPAGDLMQVRTDDMYLYLLYKDAFVIMNKEYAIRHAEVFDLEAYHAITKRYLEELQKLVMYGVDSFLLQYDKLKEDSILKSSKEIENRFIDYTVNFLTYLEYENRYKDIEALVLTKGLPPELEKFALVGLCRHYLKTYRLEKVKLYSKRLSEEYPGFSHEGSNTILDCALRISHSIDSLRKLGLDEDEFLYKEALLKQELVYCGWTGDNYYDFTIVNENYSKLLSRFPKSDFADDAELYILGMQTYGSEGDEYSEEQIRMGYNFIHKYPGSDLVPRVRMLLARGYDAYYGSVDEMMDMKEKALVEIQKIKVSIVPDTNSVSAISNLRESILSKMFEMCFDLELRPVKNEFQFGEEITFTVVLRNKTAATRKLWLYTNGPHFVTTIYPGHESTFFLESTLPDTTMKLVTVLPMDSLVQEVNLNQRVRIGKAAEIGRYIFKQSGLYHIAMHVSNLLHSEQVPINVYTQEE